jgi:hypothetical protein
MKLITAIVLAGLAVAVACSNSNNGPSGGTIVGALDRHCTQPDGGTLVQATDVSACHPDGGTVTVVDYGPTNYNAEADDDDCKYHVSFSVPPIYKNQDVTFTALATRKTDGAPAAGARTSLEVFLSDTHPAPNSGQTSTEGPAGTYKIGPIHFDQPGQWTVRFHLYEECSELLATSPHGHAAFYVWVP